MKKFILKSEDLESIGFVYSNKKEEGKYVFSNESKNNRDEKIYFGELYEDKRQIVIKNNSSQVYFMGFLKNKKELKKLLKQVLISFSDDSNQADA